MITGNLSSSGQAKRRRAEGVQEMVSRVLFGEGLLCALVCEQSSMFMACPHTIITEVLMEHEGQCGNQKRAQDIYRVLGNIC